MTPYSIVADDLALIHGAVGARKEWSGADCLITGCAGFLGFYLVQYLVRYAEALGIGRVIGLDAFLLGQPQWLDDLLREFPERFLLRRFDIARDQIHEIAGAEKARYVIHAASIASPTFYRRHPLQTIDANVWGLRRLLDFYREVDTLKGFLFFSSSEIYGDPVAEAIPTNEEYRGNVACLGPRACYDEAKRFGETLCYVFAQTYGMGVTVVRPFNNYGPGMHSGDARLPADLADSVVSGRDIVLLSDGSPTRTYCYVADAVAGYLLSLLHGRFDYFNIGNDQPEMTVRELAALYRAAGEDLFHYHGKVAFDASADAHYLTDNPSRRCPDLGKARRELGYNPQIGIEDGVRRHLQFLHQEQMAGR